MHDERYSERLDVSEVIIRFDDDVAVKRGEWKLRDVLKGNEVLSGYNHRLGYTARTLGHPSYNRFLSTLGTRPP